MKILYYSAHPNLSLNGNGGYATHMREMIQAFEELGHIVIPVIHGRLPKTKNSVALKPKKNLTLGLKDIIKNALPGKLWRTIKDINLIIEDRAAAKKLDAVVKEIQPDLIYERVAMLQPGGLRVALKYGIKHILEINAPTVSETYGQESAKSFLRSTATSLEKWQLQNTNLIVSVSTALVDYYNKKFDSLAPYVITPNAVNPEYLSNMSSQGTSEIIAKYGLSNKIVIGFLGTFFSWHRIDMLIKVFSELNIDDKCRLLLVGSSKDIKLQSSLSDLARDLNGEAIIFAGRVPHNQVYNYINAMDICVSPNNEWYMSPIKIFEYGAVGKAIIAPNTPPVNEVYTNNENAIIIEPKENELKNALIKLVQESEFRERLGAKAKLSILKNHTWKANAESVLKNI